MTPIGNNSEFDHLAPPRQRQLVSIGFLCQLLQCLPGQICTLMEDSDIFFAQTVDGIGFVSLPDAERIAEKCRDVRREIEAAKTSHQRN
ncbi:MAG: hypothetical protein IT427_07525 [Pirellulales bacterium]|nr:hypothetical protein [Pirellulales bacterium]